MLAAWWISWSRNEKTRPQQPLRAGEYRSCRVAVWVGRLDIEVCRSLIVVMLRLAGKRILIDPVLQRLPRRSLFASIRLFPVIAWARMPGEIDLLLIISRSLRHRLRHH